MDAKYILQDKVLRAQKWIKENGSMMILPPENADDLEKQFIEFCRLDKKSRTASDWASINIFGTSNKCRYRSYKEYFATSIINEDASLNDTPTEENNEADRYITNYTTVEVERAREWMKISEKIMIIPTRTLEELESLWNAFNCMNRQHCRESDFMSYELFGADNITHYQYLKQAFLNQEKSDNDSIPIVEYCINGNPTNYLKHEADIVDALTYSLHFMESYLHSNSVYEDSLINNAIDDTIADQIGTSEITPDASVHYGDMPYFSPEDMLTMGINGSNPEDNFYGVYADNLNVNDTVTVTEWFEMYRATNDGMYTEFSDLSADWVHKVRTLMFGLNRIKESGDELAINARKQSILELGWNPDIEFSDKARKVAKECAIERITSGMINTKIVDLSEFTVPDMSCFKESNIDEDNILYPVYVVLSEGKSLFSGAVKNTTKSIYSHASIAFDSTLEHMYSFGLATTNNNTANGFREENAKLDTPPGGKINVYVFFLKKNAYDKMIEFVDNLKQNINRTKYSLKNLFTYLFNIPYNNDLKMICSQFVDRCLKVAGVDITNKDSSLVSPKDIDNSAKKENRIYSVYKGLASSYDNTKTDNLVKGLTSNGVKSIRENSMYLEDQTSYLVGLCSHINDMSYLMEMKEYINLVKNESIRRMLEEVLFDQFKLVPYTEVSHTTNDGPSLEFMSNMIKKYFDPIV